MAMMAQKLPAASFGGRPAAGRRGNARWGTGRLARRHSRSVQCSQGEKEQQTNGQGADLLRAVPLVAGVAGVGGVLVNRLVSGVAPVVSASSSQSRSDVLVIVLSAVLLLTGLQWLSLKPKPPTRVQPDGELVSFFLAGLAPELQAELEWVWQALQRATRATSLALFFKGRCIMQAGYAPRGMALGAAAPGPICEQAQRSGSGNYLANLALFPGRAEFGGYLPENTQGVVVQPVGGQGVLVVGTDTQRGFSTLDQAWLAAVADKLEVRLEAVAPGSGFGKG